MRVTTVLNRMIALPGLWVKGVRFENEHLVISIQRRFRSLTCPVCATRVRGRFQETTRRWRHLAIWGHPTVLEGPIRRLRCPTCAAVRTEAVPWARPRSAFTRHFEDAVGFLAQQLNHTEIAAMTGIAWVTVGSIARRLVAEKLDATRFEDLRRIGVDEISYRRHHRYLTIVVDHDRDRVVWVGVGKSAETLAGFFQALGRERSAQLAVVSIDMSAAYEGAVREAAPQARIVFDRFHVVRLANDALDTVRRAEVAKLAPTDRPALKGTRWALLKRPEHRTTAEDAQLAAIARANQPLYRAHLLKESFLDIWEADTRAEAAERLDQWRAWAARSRLPSFVKLARTVTAHLEGILEFFEMRLTNARLEGMNNKIRLLNHRAFGFHTPDPLIATIYLCCSGIMLPQLQLI